MGSHFLNSMGADIIHPSVLNRAQALHDSGNLADAYLLLADYGDSYAAAAYEIINDEKNPLGGFDLAVYSTWEITNPGAYDKFFEQVATDHQRNYLGLIRNDEVVGRDGSLFFGLPNTYEIERSYEDALTNNGVSPAAAIDILFNTVTFGNPLWAKVVGLEPSRISDKSVTLNNINKCFPADTIILLSDGKQKPIEAITTSDKVAAFHPEQFAGRGGLESQKVVRLFENVTDTWIQLSNGLTVTPGHHFLDSKGGFRAIEDILADDGIIINEDGIEQAVTGEYIHYSAETADLFEQAEGYVTQSVGATALAPIYKKGWKTYNFEVENFHTYVAGGVRVHNVSYDFVSQASGETLWPQYVSRYDPDTGTFSKVVVYRPAPAQNDGNQTALQNDVLSADGSGSPIPVAPPAPVAPVVPVAPLPNNTQVSGSGPSVTLNTGSTATAGTTFNPGNGYTYQVNSDGSTTNLSTGSTYGGDYFLGDGGRIATTFIIYVSASVRRTFLDSKVGVRLLSDWAKAQEVEELHIHATAGIEPEHTDRFFRKLDFVPYCGNYVASVG